MGDGRMMEISGIQPLCTLTGRHYKTGRPIVLEMESGIIVGCRSLTGADEAGKYGEETFPWIAPGLSISRSTVMRAWI